MLVAADIIKTIAIELTFTSLGLLAGLVLVRTFLSWTLVLEIDGRWPWQRQVRARMTVTRVSLNVAHLDLNGRDGGRLLLHFS